MWLATRHMHDKPSNLTESERALITSSTSELRDVQYSIGSTII